MCLKWCARGNLKILFKILFHWKWNLAMSYAFLSKQILPMSITRLQFIRSTIVLGRKIWTKIINDNYEKLRSANRKKNTWKLQICRRGTNLKVILIFISLKDIFRRRYEKLEIACRKIKTKYEEIWCSYVLELEQKMNRIGPINASAVVNSKKLIVKQNHRQQFWFQVHIMRPQCKLCVLSAYYGMRPEDVHR